MRRPAALILIAFLLAIPFATPAFGGQLEDAVAAYDRGDYATAFRLFKPLAEQGNTSAQSNLGVMYFTGRGVPEDIYEALKWTKTAAERGYADAHVYLGGFYARGDGVPQDYAESVKWYRKAAEQGNAGGQACLGVSYETGMGVTKNYVLAHLWYNLAVSQPSLGSRGYFIGRRDAVASMMTPAQIAEAQRLAREWKPKKVQ